MKIVWSFFTIVSFLFCVKQSKETVNEFLSYKTVSLFETVIEVPSPFPAITLCNLNPFQTPQGLQIINEILKNSSVNLNSLEKKRVSLNVISSKYSSMKRKISFDLNKTLLFCSFNVEECNSNDFDWYFDRFFGNCFRFNVNIRKIRSITQTGNVFGLHLELFVGNSDLNPDFISNSGFQIVINNQSQYPSWNDGLELAPGFTTNLEVSRHFSSKLGYPYSDCLDETQTFDSELYRKTVSRQ